MPWIVFLFTMLQSHRENPAASDLRMIEELNDCVQMRFQTPTAAVLGMSRVVIPSSFGAHFAPRYNTTRDFAPESDRENKALAELEAGPLQVGLYLFGRAISESGMEVRHYRALKGPGAITQGTPRPAWYPADADRMERPDALPDWTAVYPLAQRAMKSFVDGGAGFETSIGSWRIAARPVVASQERCIGCHNGSAMHEPLGGVLYAFRRVGG